MFISHRELSPETLQALIEEFVSREGTDYGAKELEFGTKVSQVRRLLESGKITIVFDAETESCDLRETR
ncbi:MAG: YheU family protein [Cryobacterium sp.]|nr:YheU family protein [Oligoflexia bacterium]